MIVFSPNFLGQPIINTKTSVDTFIENKMLETGIVGIGASSIINKEAVWINGYGCADRENKIPFTPVSMMNIASIKIRCLLVGILTNH